LVFRAWHKTRRRAEANPSTAYDSKVANDSSANVKVAGDWVAVSKTDDKSGSLGTTER